MLSSHITAAIVRYCHKTNNAYCSHKSSPVSSPEMKMLVLYMSLLRISLSQGMVNTCQKAVDISDKGVYTSDKEYTLAEPMKGDEKYCLKGSKVYTRNGERFCFSKSQEPSESGTNVTLACSPSNITTTVTPKSGVGPCASQACRESTHLVVTSMNLSADPCIDFYAYSCGNFLSEKVIPDDLSKIDVSPDEPLQELLKTLFEAPKAKDEPKVFESVRKYYKSCMEMDRIDNVEMSRIKTLLQKVGGWPVLEDGWKEDNFTWWGMEVAARTADLSVDPSAIVSIGKEHLEAPFLIHHLGWKKLLEKSDPAIEAYRVQMVAVAVLMGANENVANKSMTDALTFMKKLAKAKFDGQNETLMSQSNISSLYSGPPWEHVFTKLLGLNKTSKIKVSDYIKQLPRIIEATSPQTIANYLGWVYVYNHLDTMGQATMDERLKFLRAVDGQVDPPKWQQCVNKIVEYGSLWIIDGEFDVLRFFSIAVESMFARAHFTKTKKQIVTTISDELMEGMKDVFRESEWMKEKTKENAIKKMTHMKSFIAYGEEAMNTKKMDTLYKKMLLSDLTRNFAKNKKIITKSYKDIPESVKTKLRRGPVNNAEYNGQLNKFFIYMGGLKGYGFDESRPQILNYATIGTTIGHEMTHGFDNTSRKYNYEGTVADIKGCIF